MMSVEPCRLGRFYVSHNQELVKNIILIATALDKLLGMEKNFTLN